MNRREAIQRVAMLIGGSVIGANLFLEGCTRPATNNSVADLFSANQIDRIGDLAEAILPETSTPGAKAAGVGSFIPVWVRDCYTEEQQNVFIKGLAQLDEKSIAFQGKSFQELTNEQRTLVANELDKEAREYNKNQSEELKEYKEKNKLKQNELFREVELPPPHWFSLFKQITLTGFFNSELGCTQALRYVKIPGKYDGNYPYKKGDKAFA